MRIQIYIGVIVLILIQKTALEAASLPSPDHVSVQCDSYGAEVRWKYPDLSQDVYFQVDLTDDLNKRSSNRTQNLHFNLTSMLSKTALNRFLVTVTAVRGGQRSETSSGSFSYNEFSTANITCYLDFPEVKLSPKDGELHVQFINPLQLYRQVLHGLKDDLLYYIQTEEMYEGRGNSCKRMQNTCETSVVFSKHTNKYCINLTGNIGQMLFNDRSSCFTGDIRIYAPFTVYLYPVLGVVLTLAFITAIIILLAKKYNSKMKEKGRSMFLPWIIPEPQLRPSGTLHVEPDNVVKNVRLEPTEDHEAQTMLERAEDPEEQTMLEPFSDDENQESCGSEEHDYEARDLVVDEHSSQWNSYDCPHAPTQRQEMSPGDMVDGYGPKLLLDI